jgi:hypothetical protein
MTKHKDTPAPGAPAVGPDAGADATAPTILPEATLHISGRILKAIEQAQTIGELRAATMRLTHSELEGAQGPIYQARRRIVAAGKE